MYSSSKTSASGMEKYVKGTARSLSPTYYKTAHGYTGGEIIYRKSDSTFDLAKADTGSTAEVLGVVVQTEGTDRFALCLEGEISLVASNFQEGTLTGLVDGSTLFLSATTAGKFTWTEPNTVSYISKPIATVTSINGTIVKCVFNNMRGTTVGGTNLYTTIPLNGSVSVQTVTNLQTLNVAAGEGGFIEGVIKIDATADTVTTFKVEFARPITGTTYTCTPTYGCDALPTGSSIDITSGGVIQLTLPAIPSFSSGSARFSMQAANVGTTLPIQIPSSQITWSEPTMFRNRIINGNFDIWQRGTSVASGYSSDRWYAVNSTSAAQSVDVPNSGSQYSMLLTSSVAYPMILQRIEAANARDLASKTVTISFWAKCTGTHSLLMELYYPTTTADTFGTYPAGSSTQIVSTVLSASPSSSWTYYSSTVTLPSGVSRGLQLAIIRGNVSAASTTYIAQVQLEPGSVATPFEFRSYGTELSLCQRYYWKWLPTTTNVDVAITYASIAGAGNNSAAANIATPVPMRVAPIVSHNLTNANFVTTNPTGLQWGALVSGVAFINKTGTATFSILASSVSSFVLRIISADFSASPNAVVVGSSIYMDASAEL